MAAVLTPDAPRRSRRLSGGRVTQRWGPCGSPRRRRLRCTSVGSSRPPFPLYRNLDTLLTLLHTVDFLNHPCSPSTYNGGILVSRFGIVKDLVRSDHDVLTISRASQGSGGRPVLQNGQAYACRNMGGSSGRLTFKRDPRAFISSKPRLQL